MTDSNGSRNDSLSYIDCDVPRGMTLREWRSEQARPSAGRLRAAAAVVGRVTRLRRR